MCGYEIRRLKRIEGKISEQVTESKCLGNWTLEFKNDVSNKAQT
jgi:hypothetical protein